MSIREEIIIDDFILKKANEFNLKLHENISGLYIKSSKSSWLLEKVNNEYRLYHKNWTSTNSRYNSVTMEYHKQKKMKSVVDALDYISKHDKIRYSKNENDVNRQKIVSERRKREKKWKT